MRWRSAGPLADITVTHIEWLALARGRMNGSANLSGG